MSAVAMFFCAVVALFSAHVLRSLRQTLLFPDGLVPWRFDLLLGLSLSHLVNVLLPWRAGDIVRIGFVSLRYRLRGSYVAATVVAERLCDICVVLLLSWWLVTQGWGPREALLRLMELLALLAVMLIAVAWSLTVSRRVRRWTWTALSVLSDGIRLWIADLAWSFSQLASSGALLKLRFLLLTAIMWALYLGSYTLFANASATSLEEVGMVLLGGPNRSLLQQLIESPAGVDMGRGALLLFAFNALPVVAVLIYGGLRHSGQLMRQVHALRKFGFQLLAIDQPIAGDRFTNRGDYARFLESHFTGSNAVVAKFGLIAGPDVMVVRLLPGGSDAVTAMIQTSGIIKIRKVATGSAATKLAEQATWLRDHAVHLPLASVLGETIDDGAYSYDMPFLLTARDFYEVIHTSPLAESARIVTEVVDAVDALHRRTEYGLAKDAVIDAYLHQKVIANAKQIHEFAAAIFPDGHFQVNGVAHHLDEWRTLFDLDWLRTQLRTRRISVVHGDLTIENIIVSSEAPRGWYVIDPNPANVFNSPLIDWAKLMQSLNLGYEGLNRSGHSALRGNAIELLFLRSSAYSSLHSYLSDHLEMRLGAEVMREIAFHELVNYLRLLPYKIRHAPEKALTFFACTSVLLRRYLQPASTDHQPARTLVAAAVRTSQSIGEIA